MQKSQSNLVKNNNVRGFIVSDFKSKSNATVIETIQYWHHN